MFCSQLNALAASEGFPRISIYFSSHATYPDCEKDAIQLSNALRTVERELVEAGLRRKEVEPLLAEAWVRCTDPLFWRYQDMGLAVFIEPGETCWLKLPASVTELAIVGRHFHVRPLIPILRDRGGFLLLTVTKNGAQCFNGTKEGLSEIVVEGMPSGIASVRDQTKFSAELGFHSTDRGSQVGGADAPKYAALGESPEDYETTLIEHYARDVAKAIASRLTESMAPLIIAALPRTRGYLKRSLSYRWIVDQSIDADPAAIGLEELHRRACDIAEPVLEVESGQIRAKLRAAVKAASPSLIKEVGQVLRAAEEGRVEAAFLSSDDIIWGYYDEAHKVVRIDGQSGPENEDLLNLVALKTLAQGGDVRILPADLRPDIGPLAALLRY